ncbi:MAG TPA: glycosyl transferase family 51, partial [Ktedonobacteraceae bacterium]|nr:glycosyl transferase family 51 [Ktedonobacteraceae bacterium]
WAGNANGDLMRNVIGITGAAPIWHSVMTYISGMCSTFTSYDKVPCGKQDLVLKPQTFTPPSGVVQHCVSPTTGLVGSGNCDYMLTGEVPQQTGVTAPSNNPNPTPTPQG